MFGDVCAVRINRNMIEGIISEEVVPEDEGWCVDMSFKVAVPLIEHGNDLITFLPDVLFWEEEEFSFSVDVDEHFLSFFDQGVCVDVVDKIVKIFEVELLS